MLNDGYEFDSRGWFFLKKASFLSLLLVFLSIALAAAAETAGFRPGDWAYAYAPDQSLLLLREDGTAVFKEQDFTWKDDGEFLHLVPESGEEVSIRYLITEGKTMLYFPAEYVRDEDDPGEGLLGTWIGTGGSKSSFIFREDGKFLEDGTFTGNFRIDPEKETVLLVYIKYFDDTLVYYRLDGNDALTLDYPWGVVERQAAP